MDDIDTVSCDPRLGAEIERLTPTKDLRSKLGPFITESLSWAPLSKSKEKDLISLLRKKIDLFAWVHSHMHNIYTRVVCHPTAIDSSVKLLS